MKTASGMDGARENERQEEGQQMDVLILESPEYGPPSCTLLLAFILAIHAIAEKTPQQELEVNMTMSAVPSWPFESRLAHKCQTIVTFIMKSSEEVPSLRYEPQHVMSIAVTWHAGGLCRLMKGEASDVVTEARRPGGGNDLDKLPLLSPPEISQVEEGVSDGEGSEIETGCGACCRICLELESLAPGVLDLKSWNPRLLSALWRKEVS